MLMFSMCGTTTIVACGSWFAFSISPVFD
jgi:hypothetical protein